MVLEHVEEEVIKHILSVAGSDLSASTSLSQITHSPIVEKSPMPGPSPMSQGILLLPGSKCHSA